MRQAYNLTEIRMDILDAVSLKNEPELSKLGSAFYNNYEKEDLISTQIFKRMKED